MTIKNLTVTISNEFKISESTYNLNDNMQTLSPSISYVPPTSKKGVTPYFS